MFRDDDGHEEEVHAVEKVKAEMGKQGGEYMTSGPGELVLTFNNEHSRINSKTIKYSVMSHQSFHMLS